MPGSYLIDVPRRIVFTRGWGTLTDLEVTEHAEKLKADPRHDPAFRQITDFRAVQRIQVSSSGVRHVASNNPFHRDALRSFVVASDEAFGLLRMFQLYTDSDTKTFGIFRELTLAMSWVDMDPATPWPAQPPDMTFGVS